MTDISHGWSEQAPPPHRFHRVKRGSYEVIVTNRVIGRVVQLGERYWVALSLNGRRVGPAENYPSRDHARYALVMSEEGRAVWAGEQVPPVQLDQCDRATGYHSSPHRGCIMR